MASGSPVQGPGEVPGFQHHAFRTAVPGRGEQVKARKHSRARCVQGQSLGSEPRQKRGRTSPSRLCGYRPPARPPRPPGPRAL